MFDSNQPAIHHWSMVSKNNFVCRLFVYRDQRYHNIELVHQIHMFTFYFLNIAPHPNKWNNKFKKKKRRKLRIISFIFCNNHHTVMY
jgi:hypothetical protein